MEPGHEVFFDNGRVRGILRDVSASMLTARARVSWRPSNRPSKQRVRKNRRVLSIFLVILSVGFYHHHHLRLGLTRPKDKAN
jgi:hypothetical protein